MVNVYKQYVPPASGGGQFLKLENGKTYRLRIAGEPVVFSSEFKKGEEVTVSTKYAWVVFNKEEDKAQILQLPVTGYRMIAALGANDEWGDPTKYDIMVTREVTGKETKYSVTPSTNKASLTHTQQEDVDKVDILKYVKGSIWLSEAVSGKEIPSQQSDEETDPFDGIEDLMSDVPPEFR